MRNINQKKEAFIEVSQEGIKVRPATLFSEHVVTTLFTEQNLAFSTPSKIVSSKS